MNSLILPRCRLLSKGTSKISRCLPYRDEARNPLWRTFATAAEDDSKLPLKGYRVLDMTRVLAGVSQLLKIWWNPRVDCFIALLYTNSRRSRVGQSFPRSYWMLMNQYYRAEVIKIEHPIRGDDTRQWGPPYAKYTPESGKEGPGESAYFLAVTKNLQKESPSGAYSQ